MSPFDAYNESVALHGARYWIDQDDDVVIDAELPGSLISAVKSRREGIKRIVQIDHVIVRTPLVRGDLVYWVRSDKDRCSLIELGANPGSVYTAKELRKLVDAESGEQEAMRLIEGKSMFDGKLSG
jgi:hypothetical protein